MTMRIVVVASLVASMVQAQPAATAAPRKPIQDNSFLLEEAYNQEPGVVQHISSLLFDRSIHTWVYALTDEWPLLGQRHQVSFTIPIQNSTAGNTVALGDVALNYRLQLVGSGETRLAITPRVSVVLPIGAEELGESNLAFQAALASSYVATRALALHTNVGMQRTPGVDLVLGGNTSLTDFVVGQSAIWLVHPRVNLLLETVLTNEEQLTGAGADKIRATGITVSPGIRWSHDFSSGLQIVPGLAFPIGFRANEGQRGVLLYLSFEHPIPGLADRKQKKLITD